MATTNEFTATYSVEDDKIRIYFNHFLDKEFYQHFVKMGFRKAPIQGCHFATWSAEREDFTIQIAQEIYAEGTTLIERAEAKAARCDMYAQNNANKANAFQDAARSIADRFNHNQPLLIGHHSEKKASRLKKQLESAKQSAMHHAQCVSYWLHKATGSERHANRKNDSTVRARRIKKLLADMRRQQRILNDAYRAIKLWENKVGRYIDDPAKFKERVTVISGLYCMSPSLDGKSCYALLKDSAVDPLDVYNLSLDHHYAIVNDEHHYRTINHFLNRLGYERAELGDIALYEGELTPVLLQEFLREHGADSPIVTAGQNAFSAQSNVPFPLHISSDICTEMRLTDEEWRSLMYASGYEVITKTKSAKQMAPLLNFAAGSIKTRLHGGKVLQCREMSKAEYDKIYHEHRGTALSDSGSFRLRIFLDLPPGKMWGGEWCYVFLTDSKSHPIPQESSITCEELA